MNNKGQVLVVFIIMLPIIFIISSFVIDLGFLYIEKRNINNNTRDAVEYALNNINNPNIEENVNTLLNKNIKKLDNIEFNKTDNYIEITVTKTRKSLYNIISKKYEIKVKYKGIIKNKKVIKG